MVLRNFDSWKPKFFQWDNSECRCGDKDNPSENKQRLFIQSLLQQGSQSPSLAFDRDSKAHRGMQKLYRGNKRLTRNGASYAISLVEITQLPLFPPELEARAKIRKARSHWPIFDPSGPMAAEIVGQSGIAYMIWPLSTCIFGLSVPSSPHFGHSITCERLTNLGKARDPDHQLGIVQLSPQSTVLQDLQFIEKCYKLTKIWHPISAIHN